MMLSRLLKNHEASFETLATLASQDEETADFFHPEEAPTAVSKNCSSGKPMFQQPARLALLLPLLAACDTAGSTLNSTDTVMNIVYLGMIIVLVLGFGGWRDLGGIGQILKNIALIAALFLAIIVGYTFKDDLGGVYNRVRGELLPNRPISNGAGEVTLRRGDDNHFSVVANVNGNPINFLVDTGASQVVIPHEEAGRLGFDMENLKFIQRVSTANGTTFAAPIRIRSLQVGDIVVNDVPGAISSPGDLDEGLLGLTFLDRLSRYSVEGDTLTLSQ